MTLSPQHSFHPMCGCAGCCVVEDRAERTAEALQDAHGEALAKLIGQPAFVGEALGEDPVQWEASVSAALASGDDAEAGRILRREVSKYARRCIEELCEDTRCEPHTAARRVIARYTPMGVVA